MADQLVKYVAVGGIAVMPMMDPLSFDSGGISWTLRYGNAESCKAVGVLAAGVLDSYDYLLSDAITTAEAIRRLRILRAAWKDSP